MDGMLGAIHENVFLPAVPVHVDEGQDVVTAMFSTESSQEFLHLERNWMELGMRSQISTVQVIS